MLSGNLLTINSANALDRLVAVPGALAAALVVPILLAAALAAAETNIVAVIVALVPQVPAEPVDTVDLVRLRPETSKTVFSTKTR